MTYGIKRKKTSLCIHLEQTEKGTVAMKSETKMRYTVWEKFLMGKKSDSSPQNYNEHKS